MNLLGQSDFREVAEVKADSKNRISLGRKVRSTSKHYRVYQDFSTGKILLEPLIVVPLSEPWLETHPKAKASVERGLAQAKAGRLVKAKEDFSKYLSDSE
ncbi:MAG: hypothetical protein HYU97_05690 [Deltaproteobacteria bacterium]|nr:hypothetical protein [Deltaproteobacteria bacterium]